MAAKVISGEDIDVQVSLKIPKKKDGSCSSGGYGSYSDTDCDSYSETDCLPPFPLTGCTGVSGVFLLADGVSWGTYPGIIVSSDLGEIIIPLSAAQTAGLFVGLKQKIQVLLQFGSLTRKVQFRNALDVVSDITQQSQQQAGSPSFC